MRNRRPVVLALAFLLVALSLPAQASGQQQTRSIYYRAAKAFAVDSLARTPAPPRRGSAAENEADEEDAPGEDANESSPRNRRSPPQPSRSAPGLAQDTDVKRVLDFVASPFTATPPTDQQLDSAYARVAAARPGRRAGGQGPAAFGLGELLPGASGLPSQATLILGLTDFMVERAKDELVLAFIVELKEDTKKNQFVQVAMPSSHAVLQRIEAMSIQALMPTLRNAFSEDLSSLPSRSGDTTVLNALKLTGESRTVVQATALTYMRVREIRSGVEPVAALGRLRDLTPQHLSDDRLRTPLLIVGLVSSEYGLYQDSLFALMRKPEKRSVYAGYLMHELLARVDGKYAAQVRSSVRNHQADLELLASELRTIRDAVEQAQRAPADTTRPNAVVASAIGVIRSGERFLPEEWRSQVPRFAFLEDAVEVHEALRQRNYGPVVGWLAKVGHSYFQAEGDALRYLSLASTMASARTAAEVTTALRTVSAPVGSYRLKRMQDGQERGPVVLSITGYLGVNGGGEWTEDEESHEGSAAAQFGATLPIGLEASLPLSSGSLSLYVPILDLGTVASRRFGGKGEEASAEVGFRQVFAPGAYLVWGPFRDNPLAVGVGVQSVAGLRETEQGDTLLDVWRLGAFIGVDLTLLKF